MDSAQRRTLSLPGIEAPPSMPKRPSRRTLNRRVIKAALEWWRNGAHLGADLDRLTDTISDLAKESS